MPRKNTRNTRGKIISAAWKLFYQQGYENTTIEDIIEASHTSRGSFYHYFEGKDALMGTLAHVFDEKYEELLPTIHPGLSAVDKLLYLNRELFEMIENSISRDLLARLMATQVLASGEKHLLDQNRFYFRLLRQITAEGVGAGEFREGYTAEDITRLYAMWERALLYDWCLSGWRYSLSNYSAQVMPLFLMPLIKQKS